MVYTLGQQLSERLGIADELRISFPLLFGRRLRDPGFRLGYADLYAVLES